MSNVQWRRVRVIARTIIEECEFIEKSPELLAELKRIQGLTDSSDEIVDIPRIYTEAPKMEFKEFSVELQAKYQDMLSQAQRLASSGVRQ